MGGRVSTRSLPGSLRSPRRSGLHEIHQILPTTTTPPASSPTTTSAPDPDPAHPHPRVVVVFSPRVAFFTADNRQERLTDAISLPRGIPSIMGWLHHGQAKSEPVGWPSTANLHRTCRGLLWLLQAAVLRDGGGQTLRVDLVLSSDIAAGGWRSRSRAPKIVPAVPSHRGPPNWAKFTWLREQVVPRLALTPHRAKQPTPRFSSAALKARQSLIHHPCGAS